MGKKMASIPGMEGSKSPRGPSVQPLKIKFLINIPLKVDSEEQAMARCGYLLDKLPGGFREEDRRITQDENGRNVLEDVAVIFGMNGKYTPELEKVLKKLKKFKHNFEHTHIKYSVITYTWGQDGTIAKKSRDPKSKSKRKNFPYQDIREYLKNNKMTKKLVEELRGNDPDCLIYFSFVDSDTVNFNSIYSEYIQIVQEELKKDSVPPTVMSTGYEAARNSEHYIASRLDRMTRVAVAEVHPLLVYYPEPNFCVLVHKKLSILRESFIEKKRSNMLPFKMESAVLIRQVKERKNFKAVFSDKEPILIDISGYWLSEDRLKTNQTVLNSRTFAIGAYANRVLKNARKYNRNNPGPSEVINSQKQPRGIVGKNRAFIIDLYDCEDDNTFEELANKNPFNINGEVATILVEAIGAAREFRNNVHENEIVEKLNNLRM